MHGHYARYRKALLEAGVELWELRPDRPRADRSLLALGQSLSGLHAKAFVVDRRQLFVGSFNWDPRSVDINTEMGVLIDFAVVGGPSRSSLPSRPVAGRLSVAARRGGRHRMAGPPRRRQLDRLP